MTTLGRGGTDATAVALAAALGAACEIYSDVPGVFTADPRLVPAARKLPRISYDEMLEMSASGAKVLMLRSVELARNHGVRVHARSTFSDEEGTWIGEEGMEDAIISGVTHNEQEVVFTLTGIPDVPGAAAAVFDAVAAAGVNVDTILQNVVHGVAELSFSVPREDVPAHARGDRGGAGASSGRMDVAEDPGLGKVSLVGAGMRSHPGVAAKMFRTLADEQINLRMIVTSPIKISCMIAKEEIPTALRALHSAFELDGAPQEEETVRA